MARHAASPSSAARAGRVDDVGEEDRGQHAAEHGILLADLVQEARNLGNDGVAAVVPVQPVVIADLLLDQARPGMASAR